MKGRVVPIFFLAYNIILLMMISLVAGEASILLIGLIGMIVLLLCSKGIEDKIYKKLFLTTTFAYIFMLLMYFALIQKNGIPYQGGDDELFEEYGNTLFNSGITHFKDIPYITGMWYAKGYLLVIAWIKRISLWIGEYSTLTPRILNIYLWQSITLLMYKRLPMNIDDKVRIKAFFVLATFPNALFISSFVYRDVLVCFFVVIAITFFEKIYDDNIFVVGEGRHFRISTILYALGIGVSIYFLYYLRMQICFVVMAVMIMKFLSGRSGLVAVSQTKKIIIAILIFATVISALYFSGGIELLNLTTDTYTAYRLNVTEGLSSKIFSINLLPFGTVLRFIYGLASPFPGGLVSLNYFGELLYSLLYAVVLLGTVFQLFLIPYLLRHLVKIDYSGLRFLTFFLSVILTTFTFRHFVMVYPFMLEPIVVEYNMASNATKKQYRYMTVVMLVMLAVLYLVVR